MAFLKRYPIITGVKSDSELYLENIDYNDQANINTVVCRQIKFHFGNWVYKMSLYIRFQFYKLIL